MILHEKTPLDVLQWVKREHNAWHLGSALTIIEQYEMVPEAEASWKNHCKEERITVKACPRSGEFRYEKLYEKHVLKMRPEFQTWLSQIFLTSKKSFSISAV